ncbi:MAG: arsenate reductase [Alphaproteobacteria bacterium]|nr:arsenate reductase [Alphaproteobacteria bacterium]MBU1525968.1 arsenate reductase [Alphaproteobacteria bacterium]MBU2116752.1 arsenate reductase [Alphaproteobacteria bacterium]MBU2350376.1 arsenate reductase [Alphaproteobacteria bacterium]MBU2381610.1 arsenate reductase [Alphaproteobacteria bacterium]
MITLHGIPNCDTVKKARVWLEGRGAVHAFHDYRKQGVDEAALRGWVKTHGWETVLNRKGTTFRALPDAARTGLDADRAIRLMLAQPSLIKRPVLALEDGRTLVGFDPAAWDAALG